MIFFDSKAIIERMKLICGVTLGHTHRLYQVGEIVTHYPQRKFLLLQISIILV